MSYSGKVAIVTGGASGIGLGLVKHLLTQGARVVIADVNMEGGSAVIKDLEASGHEGNVRFCACDVTSWPSQTALFEFASKAFSDGPNRRNRIDYVLANAGIAQMSAMRSSDPLHFATTRCSEADLANLADRPPSLRVLQVNLDGVAYSLHAALAYFRNQERDANGWRGKFVATASNAAFYPFPNDALYSASKHGVLGLVRAAGVKVFHEGITVNCFGPSVVASSLGPKDHFDKLEQDGRITPISTLARALDVFLDGNSKISGRIIENCLGDNFLRPNPVYPHDIARQNMSDFHSADESDQVLDFDGKEWGLREIKEYYVQDNEAGRR